MTAIADSVLSDANALADAVAPATDAATGPLPSDPSALLSEVDDILQDDYIMSGKEWAQQVRGLIALMGNAAVGLLLTHTTREQYAKLKPKAAAMLSLPGTRRDVVTIMASVRNPSLSVTVDGETYSAAKAIQYTWGKAADIRKPFKKFFSVK